MKTSEYPRDFNHKTDGKRYAGRYRQLRKAAVADYNDPAKKVEKFILEGDLADTGETVSYWLGADGKLVSRFREELERRVKAGESDYRPAELIVIEQSDEQRPSRTSGNPMWDYAVEFEHAAPPPTASDLLLGDETPAAEAVTLDEVAASADDGDDIPF